MVINCIKIDAEMYGVIPNANMEALEKAPPTNASKSPSIPPCALFVRLVSLFGSMPGRNDMRTYSVNKNK